MYDSKRPRKRFATPVKGVDDAWIRPRELLVETPIDPRVERVLRDNRGVPYVPGEQRDDWRNRKNVPVYGDINERMRRAEIRLELWVGFPDGVPERLVHSRELPGVHFNHVFIGEDFYQGGPGGPPAVVPEPKLSFSFGGNQDADVVVLDTGVPGNWSSIHAELKNSIIEVDNPIDPLDQEPNNILDEQAGHGMFICGLIARMAPQLDIQISRVLSSSGETDDSLLAPALAETTAPVINLSLGGYTTNNLEPPGLAPVIRSLVNSGRVVVAAAGNAAGLTAGTPKFGLPFWPAAMPEVISVGAVDSTKSTVEPWTDTNQGRIYAPGVDLLSSFITWAPFKGWAKWTGTSFAAPLVAAQIAELLRVTQVGDAATIVDDWMTNQLPDTTWAGVPTAKLYLPVKAPTSW